LRVEQLKSGSVFPKPSPNPFIPVLSRIPQQISEIEGQKKSHILRATNKRVQGQYPDIIRLVLSAFSDTDSILNAINEGNVYRYVIKPWNDMELKLTLRQAIEVYNLHEERRALLTNLEEHNILLEKRVEERTKQLLAIQSKAGIGK